MCTDNSDRRAEVWQRTSHHLASHYPFFAAHRTAEAHFAFAPAVDLIPSGERALDVGALYALVNVSHLLGDRTLIKGIKRAPWLASLSENGEWHRHSPPPHGVHQASPAVSAAVLLEALTQEASEYIRGAAAVGILLSGGLDSRIVAGVVRSLQTSGQFDGTVVAHTWGHPDSRDVNYAREIARRFGWDWVHYTVGPQDLLDNLVLAARSGAEFSPIHLHALPQISRHVNVDVMLAGSYGDGVGRGEFSGRRLTALKPPLSSRLDRFGILWHDVADEGRRLAHSDIVMYDTQHPLPLRYQQLELGLNAHYLRRKLQAAMGCVASAVPLFQLFTAPRTVACMWRLAPEARTDAVYSHILRTLPGDIGSLPWARTGRPLGSNSTQGSGTRAHHSYGLALRHELREEITSRVLGDSLRRTSLFNTSALERLVRVWPRATTHSVTAVDELLAWLASFADFLDSYVTPQSRTARPRLRDAWNSVAGPTNAYVYQSVRNVLRT